MTEQEKNLVKRAEKFARCNEYRHDQTRQRKFERSFESRDLEDSEAAIKGVNCANEVLASVGRRDMSLRSPADITLLKLDLEYWAARLARMRNRNYLIVFKAALCGLTAEEIGMPKSTFWNTMKILENFFGQER